MWDSEEDFGAQMSLSLDTNDVSVDTEVCLRFPLKRLLKL